MAATLNKSIGLHIFVCQGRICKAKGSLELLKDLSINIEKLLKMQNSQNQVKMKVLKGGCYGECNQSINLVERLYNLNHPKEKEDFYNEKDEDRLNLTLKDNERLMSNCDLDNYQEKINISGNLNFDLC